MTTLFFWLLPLLIIWIIGLLAAGANWGGPHVNWLDGWTRILCRSLHGLGKQRIDLPEHGPAIIVANHISGLDPLLLIAASKRPLRFLIAREEYQRFGMQWLFRAAGCIPVDRDGRPEKSLRQALKALQQGEVIAIFPHGRIHLDSDPPRKIKAGCTRLALWSQAPIIPVRIDGVGAPGKILLAPWWPSRVRLKQRDTIVVGQESHADNLALIDAGISLARN
ncbi:MAG TPA: lysophospholipid acyltransferase family protein [Methylophaga sp.]|nr:lysophospholipid acyltransferase family protein [Methylophaga sp.]